MGHKLGRTLRNFQGIEIQIENPKGSTRSGVNKRGEGWEREMQCDYGAVVNAPTVADGEDLDVYLGDNPDAPNAFLVEQLNEDGSHDEFKALLGFDTAEDALHTYLDHYPEEWLDERVGSIHRVTVDELKEAIADAQSTELNHLRHLARRSQEVA